MILYEHVCMKCGAHYLSNEEHTCAQKSKPAKKPTTSPVTKTVASSVSSPSSRRIDTPPKRVDTHVDTHVDTPPVSTQGTRLQRWRAKNREAYNAKMRAYRARQKAPE